MRTDRPIMSEKDPAIVWEPSHHRIANASIMHFIKMLNHEYHLKLDNYQSLHQWSITHLPEFWAFLWKAYNPIIHENYSQVLESGDRLMEARWFQNSRLNLAENWLKKADGHQSALISKHHQRRLETYTFYELEQAVIQFAKGLSDQGIGPGDRVTAITPNIAQSVIALLATLSVGAVWSAIPPEYHRETTLHRLEQIEPKLLIASDGFVMNGDSIDQLYDLQVYQEHLHGLEATCIIPYLDNSPNLNYLVNADHFNAFCLADDKPFEFKAFPFDHPALIVFTSGTTQASRALVHSAGGVLLQTVKDLHLNLDVQGGDRVACHARPGDSDWYWALGSLGLNASLALYDGAVDYPHLDALLAFADQEKVSVLITQPPYFNELEKALYAPNDFYDFKALKTIITTRSPLMTQHIEYIYSDIKRDVRVSSALLSGETLCALALDHPMADVNRGEFMHPPLAMDIGAYDLEEQTRLGLHEKGELVCSNAFPSLPLYILEDPANERLEALYFSKYGGLWKQGDFIETVEASRIIYQGRIDTLIPKAGLLVGTTEIYRHIQRLDEIIGSVTVSFHSQGEEKMILFVKLKGNMQINEEVRARINGFIKLNASEDYMPWLIIQVDTLPKTYDGKLSEAAIQHAVNNEWIDNWYDLENPESLDFYIHLVNQHVGNTSQ